MGYSRKWRPSKTQRREFAEKMQNDDDFANEYNKRKKERAEKRRSKSLFNYESAGGHYVPTKTQYDFCFNNLSLFNDNEITSANLVMSGYLMGEKVHHDYIHVVNEKIRTESVLN